ncbi:hypothetical protein BSZ35_06680 [Salinibacter sp. 10B]|uniref:Tll0287-like domain-containing protein n=1 Tax=Salinibacter sp. 10B TaxID=1923971 RepID=UPI000CF3DCAE|nr:DUF3365 domain-containing protein [Salinibacter sp. 10B]PQJ34325.1 hypothetical protein BSZ35_06680 [Salinibacter sp. 10B]
MTFRRFPIGLFLVLAVLIAGCGRADSNSSGSDASESPPDSVRPLVEQKIAALNDMRESLATTIDTPTVDKSTFKRVCKPVGQRAKQMSAEEGWTVQQLAERYRNPAHKLDPEARRLYEQFLVSPTQTDTWIRTERNGTDGWRYARRITVQSSCLACHGPKEQRPKFVKTGYPDDQAYGFEQGDLRGIYTVFVPQSSSVSK